MFQAWGKTDKDRGESHSLAHHSMDVAAVFARMLQLPVVRDRLEAAADSALTESACRRLAALAFLHDIGKLHPGFQAKGWPDGLWPHPTTGHLKESWAFLMLAVQWPEHPFHETIRRILDWGEAVPLLMGTMFAHHGRPVEPPPAPALREWCSLTQYDWRIEARRMDDALLRWFPEAFESGGEHLPSTPRFCHEVAGLAALADWIGSDTQFFEFEAPFAADYDTRAHDAAARALIAIGFDSRALAATSAPSFPKLTDFPEPNPAQAAVGSVDSDGRLVILEAETGSGKTEAALWRFTQLFAAGVVSSLYFAVPTRAAARQLHGRVQKALRQAFGEAAPEAVLAIPGMLRAGEYAGLRLPHWRVKWDDDAATAPQRWAAEHATRFLAATVAVGTVDQAMLAGLQVKHAHLRGSALSRSLLVIDEVHASDAYMTEILKHLLDGHLATGGYAMLMSATLGATARARWIDESLPDYETASATPYPAVWVRGEHVPRAPAEVRRPRTVRTEAVPTMEPAEAANRAVSAAEQGARVLVIRNTVTMAVATWRAVIDAGAASLLMQAAGGPALHHGRFAVEDRELLDRTVEETLGPVTEREPYGCIVIGTQTLEQSLDIDADLLVTDLCPMDVLLQRIGRLHRHVLRRPVGFEAARVVVLVPESGLDPLVKPEFENGLGGWKTSDGGFNGIYCDLAGLELTRRLLTGCSVWHIPEMNRALVEGATHPDRVAGLIAQKGEAWDRYNRLYVGAKAAEGMVAGLNVLNRETPFDDCLRFPDSDEQIMTRLGEEGVILTIDPPSDSPFGQPMTRIALPARWSQGITRNAQVDIARDTSGSILSVADWRFRYSREGLSKHEGVDSANSPK